jgi:transposase-like protein
MLPDVEYEGSLSVGLPRYVIKAVQDRALREHKRVCDVVIEAIHCLLGVPLSCPGCGSQNLIKMGFRISKMDGLKYQRYFCKNCRISFSEDTCRERDYSLST